MIDRHERHLPGQRQRFGRRESDQQRAGQAGGGGDSHGGQLFAAHASPLKRFVDHRQDAFDVGSRGDFGHDAAVLSMQIFLGGDDRGQHFQLVGDDGGGRFVTGGFDRQNFHVDSDYCARASCWVR